MSEPYGRAEVDKFTREEGPTETEINEWIRRSRNEGICGIVNCFNKPAIKCEKCTNYYCHEHFESHIDIVPDNELEYQETEKKGLRLETDSLGIKIILIEPGTIRSNFASNAIVGQKAVEPSSPYAPLVETLLKATARFMNQASPPEEVAKVILKAVTTDNPELRYLVGNDAIQMMEARKGMSDQEFGVLIKQYLFAQ